VLTNTIITGSISLNGSVITDWPSGGTGGLDTNAVNGLIASGTSLNSSNWLGWGSASNSIWATFLPISGTNGFLTAIPDYYLTNGWAGGDINLNKNTGSQIIYVGTGAEGRIYLGGEGAYVAGGPDQNGISFGATNNPFIVNAWRFTAWDSFIGNLSGTSTVSQTALAGWPTTWPQYLATNGISIVMTTNSAGISSVSGGEISIGTNMSSRVITSFVTTANATSITLTNPAGDNPVFLSISSKNSSAATAKYWLFPGDNQVAGNYLVALSYFGTAAGSLLTSGPSFSNVTTNTAFSSDIRITWSSFLGTYFDAFTTTRLGGTVYANSYGAVQTNGLSAVVPTSFVLLCDQASGIASNTSVIMWRP
jgi:hypothetical protein